MVEESWISLTPRERAILEDALSSYSGGEAAKPIETAALLQKIAQAKPRPDITIGVYGGQVQWTRGNPFPVRIVDYDGDKEDLPNVDEDGHPCRQWFEPSDDEREAQLSRRS